MKPLNDRTLSVQTLPLDFHAFTVLFIGVHRRLNTFWQRHG
jgi:hypothetical protein